MLSRLMVESILESDQNDMRFEDLCNRLISTFSGAPVLGTARTNDLGVDGRALQLDVLAQGQLVASSTRKDAAAKMREDAARLAETQTACTIFFCSTRQMGEPQKVRTHKQLTALLGSSFVVIILSQGEIADLCIRNISLFESLYADEIAELNRRLTARRPEEAVQVQLQVAHLLTSAEGFDARDMVAEHLVLDAVSRGSKTANETTVAIQALLRLPSAFPFATVGEAIERLLRKGLLTPATAPKYSLSDTGKQLLAELKEAAEQASQHQRQLLKEEIERRIGNSIDQRQLETLWSRLMLELSSLVSRLGARFIALANAACEEGDFARIRPLAADSIHAACKAAAHHFGGLKTKEEVAEALYQALTESTVVAIDWLRSLTAAWLTACELGLVPEISARLKPAMVKLTIALDTDVVLSLICDAEPANGMVTQLLERWESLGGRTLIADEVLSEVAHHAWIARVEFAEIASIIAKLPYDPGLARQISRNAFVRTFWASKRRATSQEFERFISSFSGASAGDTSAIRATLSRHTIGKRVPQPSHHQTEHFSTVAANVLGILARTARFAPNDGTDGAIEHDKMSRDSKLMAKCVAAVHFATDYTSSVLLLTSSRRLRIAARRSTARSSVVAAPVSSLAALLSLAATNDLNPKTLVALLIDEEAGQHTTRMRSELLRMLARADLITVLPRARMVSLEREVEGSMLELARKAARPISAIRKEVLSAEDRDTSLSVFGEALRKVAIGPEADRLIRAQDEAIRATRLRGE